MDTSSKTAREARMSGESIERHRARAESVRAAIGVGSGVTPASLRKQVAARAAGGAAVDEPYDALAKQIGEAAHSVTDAQVAAVRAEAGSDRGAFEIVMSASVGAGLRRWDAATAAIETVNDASA